MLGQVEEAPRWEFLLGREQAREEVGFFVFIHLGKQTLSVSSSYHTSGHVLIIGAVWWFPPPPFSRGCLSQGREWAWAEKGLGPHPLPGCSGRPARAPWGSAFVFPTPVTFAEVLPAPSAPGVPAVASPSTP